MVKKVFLSCVTCIAIFCSCTDNKNHASHLAFKEVKSDNWGIMTVDGKIIVEDEYSEEPTPVVNNIFYVKTSESDYYMYNVDNPIKAIGDKYVDIATFTDELAPAVKKGEWIKYINKNGEVKIDLSKKIKKANSFTFGYSIIENDENLCGAIDIKGKTIIPLKYKVIIPLNKKEVYAERDNKNYIYNISDKKEIEIKGYPLNDEFIAYEEDGLYGLMDRNKKIQVRAKYKAVKTFINNGDVIFAALNDDGWGIIDSDGEILIKHKYRYILECQNDMFIASRDFDEGYGLLNMKEDRLIKYEYDSMNFLPGTDLIIASKKNDNSYLFLNKEGKIINEYSALGSFTAENYDVTVESDFFDMEACADFILFGKDKNVNNLFSYAKKRASECASLMELSLNTDDITDNTWFPEKEYTSSYGDIYIQLGFNKVIESYYDGWEKKYSFYGQSSCNKANLKLKPYKEINPTKFEEIIGNKLKQKGFSEKEEDGDTIYTDGKVNVKIYIDRYSTVYVYVTLN